MHYRLFTLLKTLTLLTGLTVSASYAAAPNINVGTLHDYISGKQSTELKRIYNAGDATAFVRVTVHEIVYDEKGVAKEVEAGEILGDSQNADTLIVSPARLIIPASGIQSARLLFVGPRDKERYFRVRYIPVLPDVNDNFNLSAEESADYNSSLQAGFNLLAGYGTIVFVHPAQEIFDTQITAYNDKIMIRNNGNTTIKLDKLAQCDVGNTHCDKPILEHILPGKTKTLHKDAGRHYRFELQEGAVKKMQEF